MLWLRLLLRLWLWWFSLGGVFIVRSGLRVSIPGGFAMPLDWVVDKARICKTFRVVFSGRGRCVRSFILWRLDDSSAFEYGCSIPLV